MKQQCAPKQALKQLPDVFSLWLFLSHSRLRRRRVLFCNMKVMDPEASCVRGEFQARRKLDFKDDGDLLEINVVSGDEGEPNEFQNSASTMNHIDSIHSRIAKESIPQLNMEFETEEAAYQFYNAYAYKASFSIRRSKEHKDKSGQITSRTFCCSCEGKRGKDKRDANVKIHRPETRFGCLAKTKIRYCRVSQKYILFEFGAVHTHMLCTPSKSHLCKSHRKFAPAQALEADMANDSEFKDFAKDFSSCVYDYEEEVDFIIAWNQMLEKYELQDNDWLRRMYGIKEKWALVYGKNTFCGDMTTTQRSESMNGVLKKYANYKHDLLQFFHHFQRLIDDRRYEELKANFRATQSTPCLSFPVLILQHAADVFTPEVFKLLNAELCKAWDCNMNQCSEDGTVTTYKVTPQGKSRHHIVTYDSIEGIVSCSCKKFEFGGILCAHAFKVLGSKNVLTIPDKYILKRWTMNAESGNTTTTSASSIQDDPKAMMGIRYKELCRLHTHLATRAAESEKAYEIALDGLHKILEEVETILGGVKIHETFLETSHVQNDVVEDDAIIHDEGAGNKVKGLKVKERTNGKSSKRPRSALEKVTRNKRKLQAKPSSDGANYISGPVGQTMFVSPQYFTQQQNTQIHNQRLDVPLERNTLTPLSHLSLLTQQSQLGQVSRSLVEFSWVTHHMDTRQPISTAFKTAVNKTPSRRRHHHHHHNSATDPPPSPPPPLHHHHHHHHHAADATTTIITTTTTTPPQPAPPPPLPPPSRHCHHHHHHHRYRHRHRHHLAAAPATTTTITIIITTTTTTTSAPSRYHHYHRHHNDHHHHSTIIITTAAAAATTTTTTINSVNSGINIVNLGCEFRRKPPPPPQPAPPPPPPSRCHHHHNAATIMTTIIITAAAATTMSPPPPPPQLTALIQTKINTVNCPGEVVVAVTMVAAASVVDGDGWWWTDGGGGGAAVVVAVAWWRWRRRGGGGGVVVVVAAAALYDLELLSLLMLVFLV
ncbi:hypothetical protein RHMOL_Rhmol13G0197500 [Rhododendron molle]|uniref:Uncharacterized protein n=1 Tax=Rhododendron molle TaxID=49168 RepID=A0ACC0LA10_RHOML|nr:hypothetical protein RHMOL_Rhmol13G0197500 [Rhododendron molle]